MNHDKEIEERVAELKKLDDEEEQLLATQAEVDKEIAELSAKEEEFRSKRRFTSFEIANQRLIEPWSDPADLPKRTTTYDIVSQHLLEPWSDPALLPKRKTTHDIAVEQQLTQEYPPIEPGTFQNHAGANYRYSGTEWVLVQ